MTSLLKHVITAHRCRSTHHFIAMGALDRFTGPQASAWHDLLLMHHEELLRGAKAPDADFKDFKNHVLHVGEGEWGGARDAATEWYANAVLALRDGKWGKAAYALGVMSHYYADPIQPFHTGQTEEEGAIHRAVEWSIAKSRSEIVRRIEAQGYPKVTVADGSGFVSDMVLEGALRAHPHYQTFIDHYDVHAGVSDPPSGLDDTMLDAIADLVAYATEGCAVLFEKAIEESGAVPKPVNLSIKGYLSTLDIPVKWVLKKMDNMAARSEVAAMYKELQATGKVVKRLPDDDKAVRKLHAKQVRRVKLEVLDAEPLKPLGSKHVQRTPLPEVNVPDVEVNAAPLEAPKRSAKGDTPEDELVDPDAVSGDDGYVAPEAVYAEPEPLSPNERAPFAVGDPVQKAPSIGKKTAARLNKVGIETVEDLLIMDAHEIADALQHSHIGADTVQDWQDQAMLMLTVPGLRVHDAQILVGAGVRSAEALADASVRDLMRAATTFLENPETDRLVRAGDTPDDKEVANWIDLAKAVGE
ncbi:MAG: DUF4332 domain-containing protein [Pseudomonadota bacterium]